MGSIPKRVLAATICVCISVLVGNSAAAGNSAAGAQSSLDAVKCAFFDDYVAAGFAPDAGMPLAIAVAGDELPASVLSAFAAVDDGLPATQEHRNAVVGYFTPLCEPGADAAVQDDTGTTAEATESVLTKPPDSLASTGASSITWFAAALACIMLMSGLWFLHLGQFGLPRLAAENPEAVPATRATPASRPNAANHDPVEDVPPPQVGESRYRFWLLDRNGE